MRPAPNPHDVHLELCWKICRFGMERVQAEEERRKVLAWIERMRPKFPGSPHLELWVRIIAGEEPRALEELKAHRSFFALPPERRGWWRPLIQSEPFACVIPGRTTRERRAVLSRLP